MAGGPVTRLHVQYRARPTKPVFISNGDPAAALGAPDCSFNQVAYFAQLQTAAPPAVGTTPIVQYGCTGVRTADVQQVSFPINCASFGAGCVVPDQEHLVADRINRAVTATGSADQLYLAWRNFTLSELERAGDGGGVLTGRRRELDN